MFGRLLHWLGIAHVTYKIVWEITPLDRNSSRDLQNCLGDYFIGQCSRDRGGRGVVTSEHKWAVEI